MAAVSRVLGGCRILMAKAAPSAAAAGGSVRPATGILKVVPVSPQLAEFIGAKEVARTAAVKKIWEYIKANNLQNPENKKQILCDGKLKTIFNGKDTVDFLEMQRLLNPHFIKSA